MFIIKSGFFVEIGHNNGCIICMHLLVYLSLNDSYPPIDEVKTENGALYLDGVSKYRATILKSQTVFSDEKYSVWIRHS